MNILGKLKEKASEICYNLEVKRMLVKERLQEAKEDNRGIAVIEIILILVIILGLIIIFRKNLKEMIDKIFKQINGDRDKILKPLS
ncbi:MAG: Flp1 family type IVb pilin [Catonella sp.]